MATRLVVNQDDYLAYRNIRTADRLDERLTASASYLAQHPEGHWVKEVQPWFERAELRYWLRVKETPAGLATYLQVLPEGPHAPEAMKALAEYRERQRSVRRELLDLSAAMTEQRLAELAMQREEAHGAFTTWLGRFLAIETWGERTSMLEHEFIFAWRIDPPQARCVDSTCTKLVQHSYTLPGGGDEAERYLVMDVVLELDPQGLLQEALIAGPAMFSRVFEAGSKRAVASDNFTARIDAIAYAVDVVGGAVEARMPANRCTLEAVAPVVLHRECDGWSVQVRVAENPEEDDVVSLSGPPR